MPWPREWTKERCPGEILAVNSLAVACKRYMKGNEIGTERRNVGGKWSDVADHLVN